MNSIRLHAIGDLRQHQEPVPIPKPGESLLRVAAVGICGSDLHWYAEGSTGGELLQQPFVLGHEFAAVVADGEDAGQLVAVDPAIPCGRCAFCLEGNPNFCTDLFFAGQAGDDGAMRDFLSWPSEHLHPLPATFTAADGAMLEPLGVALHTVDLGKVKPGMRVGVFGCGPVGLLILQVARLAGAAQIVATDRLQHRLNAARALGATDLFLAADDSGEHHAVLAATRDHGVDVAFEAAGDQAAVDTAIASARAGGRVILCGIPATPATTFHAATARRKGLTIKLVRRMKHTYPRAIRLVERGLVDVRSLVTHTFPLVEFDAAFNMANSRQGLKVMLAV